MHFNISYYTEAPSRTGRGARHPEASKKHPRRMQRGARHPDLQATCAWRMVWALGAQ